MIMKQLLLFCVALFAAGCDPTSADDQQAREAAEAWGDAYFNCDYHDAAAHATPDSRRWLVFAASNTTEQELHLLREAGGARVKASEHFSAANDTMRVVTLAVTKVLTVRQHTAALLDDGEVSVTVVKRDGQWKVRMASLPQNEMRSRD